jgi:topoisomerase-4 subunit B
MDDADRERQEKTFKAGAKIEISRFKGLGEMPPSQLKETTMDPARRTLLKVVARRRPELRFQFIQEHARTVAEVDV